MKPQHLRVLMPISPLLFDRPALLDDVIRYNLAEIEEKEGHEILYSSLTYAELEQAEPITLDLWELVQEGMVILAVDAMAIRNEVTTNTESDQ